MIFRKFFNKNAELADKFAKTFNLSSSVIELILSRGFTTEEEIREFLFPGKLLDPFLIAGMKELKDRIMIAKDLKDKVLIFGDYDVDGVSATAIMLKTLKKLGIDANYYLPNRYEDGYGLTVDVIDKVADQFEPNLIITVDCGISCAKEVEYAKEKGIDIIVTDHHDIPDVLPDTLVLNAKIDGQAFPFKELCGTGLAYKISEALLSPQKAEEFLPIAALATIADIVPLLDENRRIVAKGLSLCEKYLPVGLKSLFKEFKVSVTKPNSTDISFKIAPKLNASGRMGDASDSLKLYLETDPVKIKKYIEKIKGHNTKRQEICNKILQDSEKALEKISIKNTRVIVLASKSWDQGVLGIVCSRLVDKYHRPVFLFSQVGDEMHGSGRSIDDINIHELLSSMQDILDTFGGHSMAAGVTIKRANYEEFAKRVNAFVFERVNEEAFVPIKYYDADVTEEELDDKFFQELELLEPFGCQNPRPKFRITVQDYQISPMPKFPEHAFVKLGNMELTFFNYAKHFADMKFARFKNFIFEIQGKSKKGTICDFDAGTYIVPDANQFLSAIEDEQLIYEKDSETKYTLYNPSTFLQCVSGTQSSVFGTAFVTFSGYEYVEFCKNYDLKGIYYVGINDETALGYNSVLISPHGVEWAKNFSKIVFLSPVLSEGYLTQIARVSDAEILLPMKKDNSLKRFASLNLSREFFGKIFSLLCAKQSFAFYDVFDLFEKVVGDKKIKFENFYCAVLVFEQLGFVQFEKKDSLLKIKINKNQKKDLSLSSLYGKLSLLNKVTEEKE